LIIGLLRPQPSLRASAGAVIQADEVHDARGVGHLPREILRQSLLIGCPDQTSQIYHPIDRLDGHEVRRTEFIMLIEQASHFGGDSPIVRAALDTTGRERGAACKVHEDEDREKAPQAGGAALYGSSALRGSSITTAPSRFSGGAHCEALLRRRRNAATIAGCGRRIGGMSW
jgi:hypothetical protein